METFHGEYLTGHTAAILEIRATVCDASRSLEITAKCSASAHSVAGPYRRTSHKILKHRSTFGTHFGNNFYNHHVH